MKHIKEWSSWSDWVRRRRAKGAEGVLEVMTTDEEVKSLVVEGLLGVIRSAGSSVRIIQTGELDEPYLLGVSPQIPLDGILATVGEGPGAGECEVGLKWSGGQDVAVVQWSWSSGFWKKIG